LVLLEHEHALPANSSPTSHLLCVFTSSREAQTSSARKRGCRGESAPSARKAQLTRRATSEDFLATFYGLRRHKPRDGEEVLSRMAFFVCPERGPRFADRVTPGLAPRFMPSRRGVMSMTPLPMYMGTSSSWSGDLYWQIRGVQLSVPKRPLMPHEFIDPAVPCAGSQRRSGMARLKEGARPAYARKGSPSRSLVSEQPVGDTLGLVQTLDRQHDPSLSQRPLGSTKNSKPLGSVPPGLRPETRSSRMSRLPTSHRNRAGNGSDCTSKVHCGVILV